MTDKPNFWTKQRESKAYGFMNWVMETPEAFTILMVTSTTFGLLVMLVMTLGFLRSDYMEVGIIISIFLVFAAMGWFKSIKNVWHNGLKNAYNGYTVGDFKRILWYKVGEKNDEGLCTKYNK